MKGTAVASRTLALPKTAVTEERAVSLTPGVCSASGSTVTFKKAGMCQVAYSVSDADANTFTTTVAVRWVRK